MKLTLKHKKTISLILGIILMVFMWKQSTLFGIWWFGILAVICGAYHAYLVCRYELME